MIKGLLMAYLLTISSLIVHAQVSEVPSAVQTEFRKNYPNASTVDWQVSGDKYKVMFTDRNNLHHTLLYDKSGKIASKESELDNESVPKTIREYFVQNVPHEKSSRVWKVEDETGKITYYSPVDDAVIFFDKDGKFIRRDERTPENMDQK